METHRKIIQVIKEILQKLQVEFSDISLVEVAGQSIFKIETENSGILIGFKGDRIRALNDIVRKIIEKDDREYRFMIDVNDYKIKQIKQIQENAKILAERAKSMQYDVEMQPMNGYERLIVHATLSDDPEFKELKTESTGVGSERRIVIKFNS
jgi:spoIIIJ-associated protein